MWHYTDQAKPVVPAKNESAVTSSTSTGSNQKLDSLSDPGDYVYKSTGDPTLAGEENETRQEEPPKSTLQTVSDMATQLKKMVLGSDEDTTNEPSVGPVQSTTSSGLVEGNERHNLSTASNASSSSSSSSSSADEAPKSTLQTITDTAGNMINKVLGREETTDTSKGLNTTTSTKNNDANAFAEIPGSTATSSDLSKLKDCEYSYKNPGSSSTSTHKSNETPSATLHSLADSADQKKQSPVSIGNVSGLTHDTQPHHHQSHNVTDKALGFNRPNDTTHKPTTSGHESNPFHREHYHSTEPNHSGALNADTHTNSTNAAHDRKDSKVKKLSEKIHQLKNKMLHKEHSDESKFSSNQESHNYPTTNHNRPTTNHNYPTTGHTTNATSIPTTDAYHVQAQDYTQQQNAKKDAYDPHRDPLDVENQNMLYPHAP